MSNRSVRIVLPVLLALAVSTPARAADNEADFFEAEIRPILVEHCLKCHGPQKQKGELRLDSREAMLKGGETGAAIVPNKPEESLLIQAVEYRDIEMPPSGKLSDAQIEKLKKWVKNGAVAKFEKVDRSGMGKASRKPGAITDVDRAWWAFQPPKVVPLPDTGNDWARTPVDRFIAKSHTAIGVTPAPDADRAILLRRVCFDLTGLPPEPEERERFLNDRSPDAYANLVDRLLNSPHYGERQARFWLDLVRYAESDGYRADFARPHAWRYRDYVVRSFNADKPYDRFVREQLAGDELFPDDPEALLATGYLRMWPYEYNQRDVKGQWAAILNDITDVTADVFLGMGMGCARCHDHKFDPILQKDYFSLQAFFAGLTFPDEPLFLQPAERQLYETKRAEWEAKTRDIRTKIDALLEPIRKKEMATAARRFPPEIEAIFHKLLPQRTPGERQLLELADRQVQYEYDRAPTKLNAAGKAEYEVLKKQLDAFEKERPPEPLAMLARDLGPHAAETVIPGGRKKTVPVDPAFLTVLSQPTPAIEPTSKSSMRRAKLAEWLTHPENPLTARVMVNRIWQQHFGVGIVATASDYGTLGEKPSHPELLDWLTCEFVEKGWSLKQLHRAIVTSSVYRQSSRVSALSKTKDPENRFLSRMPVRRLDAEQVRDAMLATGGELRQDGGGPATVGAQPRRSIFTRVHRNEPDALLASFDGADGLQSCAKRNITVTPTQSLMLMNGNFPMARAKAFAKRAMPAEGKDAPEGVNVAFRLAFGREPTASEQEEALTFLRQQVGLMPGKSVTVTAANRLSAWTDFCHALLNSNEFLYVD